MIDRVINFSGGRTSAYMTKRLIDEFGGPKNFKTQERNQKKHLISFMNVIRDGILMLFG
jgi:hypothetical protein